MLARVGILAGHKDGREVRYTVQSERLDAAAQTVAEVAGRLDARL